MIRRNLTVFFTQLRPSRFQAVLLALWTLQGALVFFRLLTAPALTASAGILVILLGIDGKRALRRPLPGIDRQQPAAGVLGRPVVITYTVRRIPPPPPLPRAQRLPALTLHAFFPPGWETAGAPRTIPYGHIPSREKMRSARWSCRAVPRRRGPFSLPPLIVEVLSPWGLWLRRSTEGPPPEEIKIYPDWEGILPSADWNFSQDSQSLGLRLNRRRGQGLEFHQHRDYQPGDPVRFIDWKATSRRGKPVLKEFREEQDQQILLLLDTGYRLHQALPGGTHFDQALRAALMLTYTALRHDDGAGIYAFGSRDRWIPPRKGLPRMASLLRQTYDLESSPAPSSPAAALETALGRLNRRTLIVLITNLREEDQDTLEEILPLVTRKHLLLTASLVEEEALRLATPRRIKTLEDALTAGAAAAYLAERERRTAAWEARGIITLNALPKELPGKLTEKYEELKRSGRL